MAQEVCADGRARPDFRGLPALFEFTNDDGKKCRTNCGQAAAATLLTHHGKLRGRELPPQETMCTLEGCYPPDQLFGLFGTGRRQVERICRAHGLPLREIHGLDELKQCLRARHPVIVMLGVSAGRVLNRFELPGGHWMVAYGFDVDNIYLSNWDGIPMPWDEFRRGWRSPVARFIGMDNRGLTYRR